MITVTSESIRGRGPGFAPPRIACLGTHGGHAGGAAIAMERLAAGLRCRGAAVDVVTRDAVCPESLPPERRLRRIVKHSRSDVSNTMFTTDWPAWDVTAHPAVAAADVVNLHWVAGFVGAESIRRIVTTGTPVVWTLHDMRPFTGGCHYASGCAGFTVGCRSCPQVCPRLAAAPARSHGRSRRRLRGLPLTFVTPSRWLAGELGRSSLHDPRCHAIHVIPNGIDLDRYAPATDRPAARRRLGLPEQGLAILLGSVSLDERRKGAREAAAAISAMLAQRRNLGADGPAPFVITYGGGEIAIDGLEVRHLGLLDEQGVIAAVHASDVHLTMTREDNLPNTVMEAMACGVPVVAANVGGLPEMVTDGDDGWLVPRDDAAAAGSILARLAADPATVAAAARRSRHRAVADWDSRLVGERYLKLMSALPRHHPTSISSGGLRPLGLTPAAAAVLASRAIARGPRRRLRRLGLLLS